MPGMSEGLHAKISAFAWRKLTSTASYLGSSSEPTLTFLPALLLGSRGIDLAPVWFSFFLTSFSENLAVGRIWLWGESEYHYDYMWRKIKLFIGLRI
jgi:hypothetical protein